LPQDFASAGDKKLWRWPKGSLNWRRAMNKRFLGVLLSVMALTGLRGADTQTPQVGQPAPDFSLPSEEGGLVSLKDYKGKWVVLRYRVASKYFSEVNDFQRAVVLKGN
jgi:hypothetical protein